MLSWPSGYERRRLRLERGRAAHLVVQVAGHGKERIAPGFHVDGFWSGVFGAIVYSIISWALSSLLLKNRQEG